MESNKFFCIKGKLEHRILYDSDSDMKYKLSNVAFNDKLVGFFQIRQIGFHNVLKRFVKGEES